MPIMSYLAYPKPGQGQRLAAALGQLPGCEATLQKEDSLIVLVTDTHDDQEESALKTALDSLPEMDGLSLVFAYDDEGGQDPVDLE